MEERTLVPDADEVVLDQLMVEGRNRLAHQVHRSFLNRWHSARSPVEAANFFDDWMQKIPREIRPYYEKFIAFIDERRDEIFQYWVTGVTNSPAEAVMRNIQAEMDKGRRYSEPGFIDTMTIKEDMKRRCALGIGDDSSPLDPDRESELSTKNSQARSAEMARRFQNRASKNPSGCTAPMPGAENDPHVSSQGQPLSPKVAKEKNEQASPVEFSAVTKSAAGGGLDPRTLCLRVGACPSQRTLNTRSRSPPGEPPVRQPDGERWFRGQHSPRHTAAI